jgi:hypothetical protein
MVMLTALESFVRCVIWSAETPAALVEINDDRAIQSVSIDALTRVL